MANLLGDGTATKKWSETMTGRTTKPGTGNHHWKGRVALRMTAKARAGKFTGDQKEPLLLSGGEDGEMLERYHPCPQNNTNR